MELGIVGLECTLMRSGFWGRSGGFQRLANPRYARHGLWIAAAIHYTHVHVCTYAYMQTFTCHAGSDIRISLALLLPRIVAHPYSNGSHLEMTKVHVLLLRLTVRSAYSHGRAQCAKTWSQGRSMSHRSLQPSRVSNVATASAYSCTNTPLAAQAIPLRALPFLVFPPPSRPPSLFPCVWQELLNFT